MPEEKVFKVYYKLAPTFMSDPTLSISNLGVTHKYLREVKALDLEDAWRKMQGEVWSPHGEARSLIMEKGLKHTSMSIGDVLCDQMTDKYYEVLLRGFRELGGEMTQGRFRWCPKIKGGAYRAREVIEKKCKDCKEKETLCPQLYEAEREEAKENVGDHEVRE